MDIENGNGNEEFINIETDIFIQRALQDENRLRRNIAFFGNEPSRYTYMGYISLVLFAIVFIVVMVEIAYTTL